MMNVLSYMMTADRGSFSKAKYLVVFCSSSCKINSGVSIPEMSFSTTPTRKKRNGNVEVLFVNVNDFDQFQQSPKLVTLMGLHYKTNYYTISQLGNIRNLLDL